MHAADVMEMIDLARAKSGVDHVRTDSTFPLAIQL